MTSDDFVVVARIGSPYGVKGWVKLISFTQPIENISDYAPWFIQDRAQAHAWRPVQFDKIKRHGKGLVAHITGCDDRDQAQRLTNTDIAIQREQLPTLEDGDYYWSDLIGLTVMDVNHQAIGKVDNVFETGANDVLVVKQADEEILIPYVPEQVVLNIDLTAGTMTVNWEAPE